VHSDKSKGFHSPSPGQSRGWEKHRPGGDGHPGQSPPPPLVTTPASDVHPHRSPRGSPPTPPSSSRSAPGKPRGGQPLLSSPLGFRAAEHSEAPMNHLAAESLAQPGLWRASSCVGLLCASHGILLHLLRCFFLYSLRVIIFFFLPRSTNQLPEPATRIAGEAGGWLGGVTDGTGDAGCRSQGHVQHFNWPAGTDFLPNSIF